MASESSKCINGSQAQFSIRAKKKMHAIEEYNSVIIENRVTCAELLLNFPKNQNNNYDPSQ